MKKLRQLSTWLLMVTTLLLTGCHGKVVVLDPKGPIAAAEKHLLIDAVLLMLIVVIPVIILTFYIARRYRASNTKAKYSPNFSHSSILELAWWSIPIIIVAILGVMAWRSTHKLDPYRPLNEKALHVTAKPLTIQVVALRWRWLFIYPQQHIATINTVAFPVDTPIRFYVTSDAPMNSFQIQQLAGQIYAMNGMQTQLHLMADQTGTYRGRSVSFSGDGFANMKFPAYVMTHTQFEQWVNRVENTGSVLNWSTYSTLAGPTTDTKAYYFTLQDNHLFHSIIQQFSTPSHVRKDHLTGVSL